MYLCVSVKYDKVKSKEKQEAFCVLKVQIREAVPADYVVLSKIEAAGFPPAEAAGEDSLRERLRLFSPYFLVAEAEGVPVGYIGGNRCSTRVILDAYYEHADLHESDGPYQSVFSLVVLPDYRGKGIAQQLMWAFIELAKQRGLQAVILTCKKRLVPFYEQFGYRCMGVSDSTHGGAVWYDMFLPLSESEEI